MRLNYVMRTSLIDRVRADLDAARFSVETLTSLWGDRADAALHRGQRVPALRALAAKEEAGSAAVLATLFILGTTVPTDRFEAAMPRVGVAGAVELGLVVRDGASIRPLLDLRPYSFVDLLGVGSWWIASDLGEMSLGFDNGAGLRENHVLGVGGASMTLTGLMVGTPVERALDLGTGCGIQAMHAARHATAVVATDISQRTLDLAALNAELNGIHNIEFRLGSLFEPVAGERFDQIVSNPPFVITPRATGIPAYEYRDGGMVGDALVQAVVAGVADHLEAGGVAQLLGNWEYRSETDGTDRDRTDRDRTDRDRTDGDGLDRVACWTDATGLDAWVVEREVQDVARYAETWIRDGALRPGTEFDRLYDAWLTDFENRGVDRVGFGYLTLRRPAQPRARSAHHLRRFERLDGPIGTAGPFGSGLGEHIAESLAAWDRQSGLSDEALGRCRLTVAPDVTEERHYWPGATDPTVMTLRQGSGFGRSIALSTGLAGLVGASDGELSVRAIIAAIAELLEVDEAELTAELLPRVRELIDAGFLRE